MVNKANFLLKKKIIVDKKPYFNILLGSLGTSPLHIPTLAAFLSLLPPNAVWSFLLHHDQAPGEAPEGASVSAGGSEEGRHGDHSRRFDRQDLRHQ